VSQVPKSWGERRVLEIVASWGTWVAQSVECLTLGLTSGLDLRLMCSSPALGSTVGMEPA